MAQRFVILGLHMTTNQLRDAYLSFFQERGHTIIPSASLLPENDPSTLFTGSGMQPMVPFLLGEPHPLGSRIADSQACFRSQDIEEVGDNRHTTFFEMLGNWSLGDYFKQEQIRWMFAFLVDVVQLNPANLYVTVFRGNDALQLPRDTESVALWQEVFASKGIEAKDVDFSERDGMQGGRIFYYDEKKNWWSRSGVPAKMPVGEPGGPDTEMFWDFGVEKGLHEASAWKDEPCHVNCDCGRFLEIGNNVFMQYRKAEDGSFVHLPKQNVDFGGGLERLVAVSGGISDIFLIDAFTSMRKEIEKVSNTSYGATKEITHAYRVILDHVRAAVFLMASGAMPANKDQGYFTRRLLRRSVRFGKRLGIEAAFLVQVATAAIETYASAYPMLTERRSDILLEIGREEEKFRKTLGKGEKEFQRLFEAKGSISGDDAFLLYATYGFPLELTKEMALERGQSIQDDVFQSEFRKHQDLSRLGAAEKFAGGLADHSVECTRLHTATHLLHQALRTVLGNHVVQKGSNITRERLRFDFPHPQKMTPEELAAVEHMVNEAIAKDLPVHYEVLDLAEAKARGAIGLFEDTYAALGNQIKVYFVGDAALGDYASAEVCGGPHVTRTGELGHFRITKEESASSGVRRIKAVLENIH